MLDKVTKVLVAEQMSLKAIRDFAATETAGGWPTFVHDGKPKDVLENGLHFIYQPSLTPAEITAETADGSYFGLMVRPKKVLPETKVEAVVRVGTGVINLKDWWLAAEDRIAMNTPAQNAVATAEFAVKALERLMAPTHFDRASSEVQSGHLTSTNLSEYTSSREMNEKTVLVAGMGDIGIEVAKRLKAQGVNVIGWGYTRTDGSHSFPKEKADKFGIGWADKIENVIGKIDAVTIHVKGEAQVITRAVLEAAKPGLKLVNAARAACVDVPALGEAVKDGRVAGFVIDADYFPGEARDQLQQYINIAQANPNNRDLLTIPHFGGDVTVETNYKATMQGVTQLAAAVWGKKIINPQGFSKDRSPVPAGYTDGGVVKPKGVGVIGDESPSSSVSGATWTIPPGIAHRGH